MEHNTPSIIATIDAVLNGLSTILLSLGWAAIRQKDRQRHQKFMIAALVSSTLFLILYVLNRIIVGGLTHYQGQGMMRTVYFIILGTHTPLAMIIVPFSIIPEHGHRQRRQRRTCELHLRKPITKVTLL